MLFAEILHAGRGAIDMKHIKQDLSLKAWVQFLPTSLAQIQKKILKSSRCPLSKLTIFKCHLNH